LEAVLNNELGSLKWRVFAGSGNLVSLDIVVFPRPHLVERQLLLYLLIFLRRREKCTVYLHFPAATIMVVLVP